jgi:hypothetical protein
MGAGKRRRPIPALIKTRLVWSETIDRSPVLNSLSLRAKAKAKPGFSNNKEAYERNFP